jgi:hypothetical protein
MNVQDTQKLHSKDTPYRRRPTIFLITDPHLFCPGSLRAHLHAPVALPSRWNRLSLPVRLLASPVPTELELFDANTQPEGGKTVVSPLLNYQSLRFRSFWLRSIKSNSFWRAHERTRRSHQRKT